MSRQSIIGTVSMSFWVEIEVEGIVAGIKRDGADEEASGVEGQGPALTANTDECSGPSTRDLPNNVDKRLRVQAQG